MCHAFLADPTFYRRLEQLDAAIAESVGDAGCPCGGALHRADYPRKPRGPLPLRCLLFTLDTVAGLEARDAPL